MAQVVVQEAGHLAGHLQLGDVGVQVEPIHAVQLEGT